MYSVKVNETANISLDGVAIIRKSIAVTGSYMDDTLILNLAKGQTITYSGGVSWITISAYKYKTV